MLLDLSNEPRDYDWGSTELLAQLTGRTPSGRPEAEVWFGDHPGDPATIPDGRSLDAWIADEGARFGVPDHLPYLLKLLAAASPLSIQVHPSKAQAEVGFEREESAGIPRDAAERTYRDANHKPELIVAVSETFRALAGLRELDATRRLVGRLGAGARELAERLSAPDAALDAVLEWVLSEDGRTAAPGLIAAASQGRSDEFAAELDLVRELDSAYPGDPGVIVALLMNLVTIPRGVGLFVPAGVLHAYLSGLGVELMAASDNVLRGGLTPKHIDVAELLAVLDPTPGPVALLHADEIGEGLARYAVPVGDFTLLVARVTAGSPVSVPIDGVGIALATVGEVSLEGGLQTSVVLRPGAAVLVTPDEGALRIEGDGEVFIALPGARPTVSR
ncbi:mannose-6-phosphate isomerase, class I [Microbacterium pumilum]|uniref:mannose-6-phosphate isomerase n=1 Tax=Microbacterium pumilum TaxID=344165 RepID=A0ABP5DV98_9MICO